MSQPRRRFEAGRRAAFQVTVPLSDADVDRALGRVAPGLERYQRIESAFNTTNVAHDPVFQRRFNAFYRVRRGPTWRAAFYRLLERGKSRGLSFAEALRAIHRATGRVEASFASKLVATLDPDLPVIDRVVLGNLSVRLAAAGPVAERLKRAVELHAAMSHGYRRYLATPGGKRLVREFARRHRNAEVSRVKMLDLVLWQHR